ncbi:MAG: CoA transferase [Acidimicrobiales bacterium]|nr:CoA transferase [Acidimicrobiales bacterium]
MRPLEGIRVVEVAQFTFVPAAGAVLADWGAEIIKVEHATTGDGQRGLRQLGSIVLDGERNPAFEHPNRGKRSVGVDIGTPEGLEIVMKLVDEADVFLTNFLPAARQRLRIDVEHVQARNSNCVYARGSAVGDDGEERENGGYDMTGYWCRAGSSASITPSGSPAPIPPPPAYGDTIGGMTIAGGIAAALLGRARTGHAPEIDVSLLSTGMWAMALPISVTLDNGQPWVAPPAGISAAPTNPLAGIYETSDGRHLSILGLQGFRYWADFCAHIDRPDLVTDERFADAELMAVNAPAATAIMREVFATRTLAEWTERFVDLESPWAPIQNTAEVVADRQARANGYIATVHADDGDTFELVSNPVRFDRTSPELKAAPAFAVDTDDVLGELGYEMDAILELKVAGVIT